ncbi:hypothetical protein COCMIDRAFT_40687 [Bipolaris oryzae ATCC 44560]|uniref:Haloacid dehalogenase n=1 Tax=Bipolaris oryzae ATCC 44560 TaxID=930090 RepID=W6YZX4_COCMI|nr:uncharacterized protein COCMIDRAFT_40687 [Bipolaris oryzae ATCC 44560]EUC41079.1 hypothetical protein COCMIDRAFT_40687 [Bipolaris oryzae ATCC 44560]
MVISPTTRALFFDVFGTCVDWRSTVVGELEAQAHFALNLATVSSQVRFTASDMTTQDWNKFAQQWRDGYKAFTRKLASDSSIPWKTVDEHYLETLRELVVQWHIEGLWNDEQLCAISLIWHRLDPWTDSAIGVSMLNKLFYTCTLSNGNLSLLEDLRTHTAIPFTHLFSAELFGTYKPSPRVYLGAADKLQLPPTQCAMVAAHLNDLRGAKNNGMQTIYVERPGEEEWDSEQIEKALLEGWVDLWIGSNESQGSFVTVAERLGIELSSYDEARRFSASTIATSL